MFPLNFLQGCFFFCYQVSLVVLQKKLHPVAWKPCFNKGGGGTVKKVELNFKRKKRNGVGGGRKKIEIFWFSAQP